MTAEFLAPDDSQARKRHIDDNLDQLAKELRREKATRGLWESVTEANSFIQLSSEPEKVYDYYTDDSKRSPLYTTPLSPSYQEAYSVARSNILPLIEKAAVQNPRMDPTVWMAQNTFYDPDMLALLQVDDLVNLEYIESVRMQSAFLYEQERALQREVDRRVQANERRNATAIQNLRNTLPFGMGQAFIPAPTDQTRSEIETLVRGEKEAMMLGEEINPAADLSWWEETVQNNFMKGAVSVSSNWGSFLSFNPTNGWRNAMRTFSELDQANSVPEVSDIVLGAVGELGTGIEALATGVGGLMWAIDGVTPGHFGVYDAAAQAHRNDQEELYALAANYAAAPDQSMLNQLRGQTVESAWATLETEQPDAVAEYLDMAGGDFVVAQGLFGGDLFDSTTVQAQFADMADEAHSREKFMIEELADQDFRFSDKVMDVLSLWGRNVPGRLATSFTLLLSDSDMHELFTSGKFGQLWDELGEESSRLDHTPSAALGIDGSAVGLAYDLGMGIAFDPTTYLFGPKFAGIMKNGAAATLAEARALSTSAIMQRWTDDIVRYAYSDARGMGAFHNVAGWLDQIGLRELSDALHFTNKQLPVGKWGKEFPDAQEVSTATMRRVLAKDDEIYLTTGEPPSARMQQLIDNGDATVSGNQKILLDDAEALADSIKANGFDEPIELTISRADGTVHVTNGRKRLVAAELLDLRRVPVRVRVTDDAAKDAVRIANYSAEESELVAKLAGEFDEIKREFPNMREHTKMKEGADEGLRGDLLTGNINDPVYAGAIDVGTVQGPRGVVLRVKRYFDGEGGVAYLAVDEDGSIVSATLGNQGKEQIAGYEIGIAANRKGAGTTAQIWDLARGRGDDFLLQGIRGAQESISEQGLRFINKYAKHVLEQDGVSQLRTVGKQLDEAFPEGLASELDDIANNVGEAFYRPEQVLKYGDINPELNRAAVADILQRAVLRGARPQDAARRGVLIGQNGMIRDLIRKGVPESWRRMFTPGNTTTRMSLNNPREIMEQAIKIWGDDTAKADEWLSRIYQAQIRAADDVALNADEIAKVHALYDELRVLASMSGGDAWTDAWVMGGLIDDADLAARMTDDVPVGAADDVPPPEFADDVGLYDEGVDVDVQFLDDATTDEVVSLIDEGMATPPSKAGELLRQARANQKQLQEAYTEKLRETEKAARALHSKLDTLPTTRELHDVVREMWEDYNRTYIVPRWQKEIAKNPEIFDNELGIVKWDALQRGLKPEKYIAPGESGWLPETLADDLREAGIDQPEKLARTLNSVLTTPMTTNVPMSPLDLIAAGTASGKRWTKWTHNTFVGMLREGTHYINRAWVIDKVLRPATAMTVSGDEILRIFHKGGNRAVARYINDRLLFTQARVQHAIHGGNPLGREAVRKGAKYSTKVRQRLAELDYYTTQARQWERIFYDGYGNGWVDVTRGSPEFLDAAKMWTGQMMQQSGFRAFLRGEEAFTEWFLGVDGQQLRNATVMKPGGKTGVMDSAAEAYRGWSTLFDDVILKRAKLNGNYDEVRRAFREGAEAIDNAGGKAQDLPDWVYDNLEVVRGIEKYDRRAASMLKLTDRFFDQFFLDPVNYRRGFVADMVAKTERARLESLYASQGIRIVSDMEASRAMGYRGLSGASRNGVSDFMAEAALKRGMVTESFIDDLVQRAVDAEIEHMLYVTDKASRAGNIATSTLFPFGKPYADMMAFWGKEMFRRPHLRGLINDQNQFSLGNILTANGNLNPRTPALISRLAHTDFDIDQGFAGTEEGETQGLFPGSESTNLSPLLFLPTKGENPFYSMLPGLGYIPMWGIDMVMQWMHDPIEDPLAYTELQNKIGDVIPGAFFGNPDPIKSAVQRLIGGGTYGQITEAVLDVATLFGRNGSYHQIASFLGQPDREIDRGRYMSAVLANPDEWEELFALESGEDIVLYLDALAAEADNKASSANLQEQSGRFFLPTNSKFAGELDQIWDVWLDSAQEFPELSDGTYDDKSATPEERTQYVNDIRDRFFDLPQWQRDAYIAAKPEIAVNLISTWDWTDEAYSDGVAGTTAYRTDGSREGLARHQIYINMGYVRPLSPVERARRIVGLHLSAKESTAKKIYESTTNNINDYLWENAVSEETVQLLQAVLDEQPEWAKAYDVQTPRELWDTWSRYEQDLEADIAEKYGYEQVQAPAGEPDTAFDILKQVLRVPEDQKPWGTSWPGVDPENLSNRFSTLSLTEDLFSEDTRTMADILGVELREGMTGQELYSALQSIETSTTGPLSAHVDPAYQTYLGERSAAYRVADENIREIAYNTNYAPEWRENVKAFIDYADRTGQRFRGEPLGVPPSRQLEVQDRYMKLMNTADDHVIADWQQLWELRYERAYGPLGWTPPEPLSPFDESGKPTGTSYQPFIQSIIDGDSLVVGTFPGDQRPHEVRLLGVRARDFGIDNSGAEIDKDRLWDRLQQALRDDDRIFLVRDPDNFGSTDIYGRELAWLWIEDESFSFPEEMLPNRDPSGGK